MSAHDPSTGNEIGEGGTSGSPSAKGMEMRELIARAGELRDYRRAADQELKSARRERRIEIEAMRWNRSQSRRERQRARTLRAQIDRRRSEGTRACTNRDDPVDAELAQLIRDQQDRA